MSVPITPSQSACGVTGWPFEAGFGGAARPARLPDGRPWPRIGVLILPGDGSAGSPETTASIARQDYPELTAIHGTARELPELLETSETALILREGDMLAPGALVALALEMALSGASAVAGLRVLYRDRVLGLDVPSLEGHGGEIGGDVLWSAAWLTAHVGATPEALDLDAAWARLPFEARSRVGRPVLLQRGDAPSPSRRLAIVSLTGTGTSGGAGVAHRRLAEALTLSHHTVTAEVLSDLPAAAEWVDRFPDVEARIVAARPDFVMVGNVHGATRSLDAVGRLADRFPTALVLHDLFALTGRCCHPRDCHRAETGCDASCPTPDEYPQLSPKRIAAMHERKRAVLAGRDGPILLANSDWTRRRSEALAPASAVTRPISLAFPTSVFRPGDRKALRRRLGLPEADVLILVSSVIVDGPDKGFADLREALRAVMRPGVGVVAIGRLDDPRKLGIAHLFAPGLIAGEEDLAAWYGACDLHVTASRHETLGQTPIEAGLCGVPTLAYRTSGLTSAVIDNVSGRLVALHPDALARSLAELIADGEARARLGAYARIAFESRFSPAAAALSLDAVLRERGLVARSGERLRFAPEMLGHFAFAAERVRGAEGTVPASSSPVVRRLRRTKQALLGRRMPLIVRRCLYLASTLRRRAM